MNASLGGGRRSDLGFIPTIVMLGALLVQPLTLICRPREQDKPLQYDVRVINIEVPVRVFSGDTFVDGLTLKDFEIYENGVLQDIEAVYLIKKSSIERKEETRTFSPEIARYFYLFFVLYQYNPKIRDAVSYFVENVLRPEDHLVVVTPKTTYEMKQNALAAPKTKIVDRLNGIIRKDILAGEAAYRSVLRTLKRMSRSRVRAIEDQGQDPTDYGEMGFASMEEYFIQYRAAIAELEAVRKFDDQKLLSFAAFLKEKRGQKFVYIFYEREFLPVVDKETQAALSNNLVLKPLLDEMFGLYTRTPVVDMSRLRRAFADSFVTVHFLYLTTLPTDIAREQMEERSFEFYEAFAEAAKATGGLATSSSNTAALMQKASDASENYYLLYYAPKDKTADGKFREIKVNVKPAGYRVTHLAGYFAK